MLRFIVNKKETKTWSEISPETLLDWVKEDGKEREKITKEWISKTRHGEIYLYGTYQIISLELPDFADQTKTQ